MIGQQTNTAVWPSPASLLQGPRSASRCVAPPVRPRHPWSSTPSQRGGLSPVDTYDPRRCVAETLNAMRGIP
ncbi:hypothetical protein SAMN02982922_3474 [Mesorhizobium australicum]|uniref:Uncharacterized protein n=1 Tax=Mesorhizobium australicum TaxID=536018 RepID=A0A1X7P8P0_9HYPH|nr:hypothetical protein SAMN02982922_3474 [Mesorhizobium australicum]